MLTIRELRTALSAAFVLVAILLAVRVFAADFGQRGLMGGVGLQGNKITALAK